jgi:thiosulfate reductase cytochrome b subunit
MVILLLAAGIGAGARVLAQAGQPEPAAASPIHPTFALLDAGSQNVLESGGPVSTLKTCGECHDTGFIAGNSDHASLGLDPMTLTTEVVTTGGPTEVVTTAGEMSCFLCHTPDPDNDARRAELESARPDWANTASLLGSGIVTGSGGNYQYNPSAFSPDGELLEEYVRIQDPTSANCGQCHGTVHTNLDEPFVKAGYAPEEWRAALTGQVISPQKLADSGMNLAGKESLARTWDIHAERAVSCTDCHFSLNNPVYFQEEAATRPEHLEFDPRRLELGEYLQRPVHQFARGGSDPAGKDPAAGAMRRCESCHSEQTSHSWLPYTERHMDALSCETCHIPQNYAAATQQVDRTVLNPDGSPRLVYRGAQGDLGSLKTLVNGYTPVLATRPNVGGQEKVAPFNLVTEWYWAAGDPAQPVNTADLEAAWLDGEAYHADVVTGLDVDGDKALTGGELVLDTPEKAAVLAARLESLGLQDPHIAGAVRPYPLNHGVTAGEWATEDCATCHSRDSRLAEPMLLAGPMPLASAAPGGVLPELASGEDAVLDGEVYREADGALYYRPASASQGLYLLGHDNVAWIDLLGSLFFAATLLGVAGHGTFRFLASLKLPHGANDSKKVYMYGVYERLWHWLQTFTVLGLLFTGLVIHKPDTFGLFSFKGVVLVHNVLAGLLLANAALSLFYHLASGEIKQFIPRPAGFFDQAIVQALFYLRGIFRGERHPFEKTPQKKLNPLQQATYFGLLNVLLPLQILTGALMWGVQHWPDLAARLGGLPFLAPFHTLIAWLFAAFVVGHVYLTTTGPSPFASIQAMMIGWDSVEPHSTESASPEAPVPAQEAVEA